jgi:arabinoxylan arabinofuranohydrolase
MRTLLLLASLLASRCAGNILTLTDRFTADPAPIVHDGRLYVFTSHDLADQNGWLMTDYSLMSTQDLANWRDDGIPFDLRNQSWGEYAWAQQVIQAPSGQQGFYMYYPAMQARPGDNRSGTGVAFSPSIEGPFNDALGRPLLPCGDDPTVFRDDDAAGTAYLCGNCNGGALCARLAPNMTALASAPTLIQLPQWFEAPWLSKWQGVYYLSYMCAGDASAAPNPRGHGPFNHFGYDICYGSCAGAGCSPLGPYVFRGSLMWSPPGNCGRVDNTTPCSDQNTTAGANNHQGIAEFPQGSGALYLTYHTRSLAYARDAYKGYQRNVGVDRLYARASAYPLPPGLPWVVNDTAPGAGGGLLPVSSTPAWTRQLQYVDPYARVPAALSSAMSAGMATAPCAEGGRSLGSIASGASLQLRGVDFGAAPGAATLTLRAATPLAGASVSVLADGALLGTCSLPSTGGWQVFQNTTCSVSGAAGVAANLTFAFHGPSGTGGLLNLLYWSFAGGAASGAAPPPVAVRIALRSAATGQYACARAGDGAVTAASAAPCAWVLADQQDGTWALGEAGAGGRWACLASGSGASMAASEAAPGAACTRFWLYGTPVGSYALLSAGAGQFVAAAAGGDAAAPLAAGGLDPRTTPSDGARFFLEEGV